MERRRLVDSGSDGMNGRFNAPLVKAGRQERRVWWGGLLASVALHLLVLLLWRSSVPPGDYESPTADDQAPAGGGGLQAVHVREERSVEIRTPPRPILVADIPVPEVFELDVGGLIGGPAPIGAPLPSPGVGSGEGTGSGSGTGAGTEDYTPPVPLYVVPQWEAPDRVRGLEVTVRVFVDAEGGIGIVELDPPTPDNGFNREIVRQVRRWEYRPARREGASVEGWAEITFIF